MVRSTDVALLCTICLTLWPVREAGLSNSTRILPPVIKNNAARTSIPPEPLLSREGRHALNPPSRDDLTTLAFIEVIVKRTVNQYMKVIRTHPDWFERLLHLVREELDIRSKYNCSTDACIYKIQLFTHYLHSHLMGGRSRIRPRVRRSAEPPSPLNENDPSTVEEEVTSLKSAQENLPNADVSDLSVPVPESKPFSDSDQVTSLPEVSNKPQPVDDALRLPEVPSPSKSQNKPISGESLTPVIENDSSRPQVSHFGTPDKINMVRVSQEVLSEALSKQQRGSTNPVTGDDPAVMKVDQTPLEKTNSEISDAEVLVGSNLSASEKATNSENESVPVEQPTTDSALSDNPVEIDSHQTEEPVRTTLTSETDALTSSSVEPPELSNVDMDVATGSEDDTLEPNRSWANEAESDSKRQLHLDLSVQAIPFGQNEFVGKPYENCTGRFENYCYNALKCVYISVLETAACYCRTGYTGVRCDMFNLPQTLDILKSFKEEIIDVRSLHQTNAITLYSVVEATARYTVNAVLEENLISTWEDDSML